ncbi:MAG: SprT family zinc-dependent metalloprotease [Chloroflexota bacterium]
MSEQSSQHALAYGATTIAYQLSFTTRQDVAIHVHPDTRVTVEAPLDSEFAQVEARVRKRAAWIVRQQRNFRRYSYEIPPRQYVSGESHRYLGRQYRLKVLQCEGRKESVTMDRERILVYARTPGDRERIRKLVDDWHRQQARLVFAGRVELWQPRFERYGVQGPQVVVRRMNSRWGSCTAQGKITLNLKLIQVPKRLIDYVVVHELCHLVENNHGEGFYALMRRMMPDWEGRREGLNGFEF